MGCARRESHQHGALCVHPADQGNPCRWKPAILRGSAAYAIVYAVVGVTRHYTY